MAKSKRALFLSPETCRMIEESIGRHERFTSTSQSVDHLLRRALLDRATRRGRGGRDAHRYPVQRRGGRPIPAAGDPSALCEEVQVATGRLQTVLASPAWDGATERRTPLGANVGSGQ
jgi:hypothetical protein